MTILCHKWLLRFELPNINQLYLNSFIFLDKDQIILDLDLCYKGSVYFSANVLIHVILECLLRRILICFSLKVHKGLFCCVKSVSSRNATSQYFHFRFILCYPSSCLVYNMSKNGEKCRSVPPGAWDDVLTCLVLSTAKKIRSLLSERSKTKVQWKLFKPMTSIKIVAK